jgi:hypothetical protein
MTLLISVVFSNLAAAFTRGTLPKPFLYRCLSELVSGLERSLKVSEPAAKLTAEHHWANPKIVISEKGGSDHHVVAPSFG